MSVHVGKCSIHKTHTCKTHFWWRCTFSKEVEKSLWRHNFSWIHMISSPRSVCSTHTLGSTPTVVEKEWTLTPTAVWLLNTDSKFGFELAHEKYRTKQMSQSSWVRMSFRFCSCLVILYRCRCCKELQEFQISAAAAKHESIWHSITWTSRRFLLS